MINKTIITAHQLSKTFGAQTALDALDFEIKEGEILGFLGPSGSGKTTTINILTGQMAPSQGEATILGKRPSQLTSEDLATIGLVTEHSGYYEKMTLYHNLLFFAKLHGVANSYLDDLMKRVGLYESRKTPAEKLSTGMKQRMLLVRAIINQPQVLFLDEPTSGLDPSTSQAIHQLIQELKEQGTTIFLTTHDMQEATLLCDQIVLLNQGHIVEEGSPQDLIQKYNQDKQVRVTYQSSDVVTLPFAGLADLTDVASIVSLHSCEPTLEDIFIQLTGGKLNA